MILPNLDQEMKYWGENREVVAGIDEAGRGPLAGPVVAGAVVVFPEVFETVRKDPQIALVRDSKTLSEKQREKAFGFISENFIWGVGISSHDTIDRINILQAAYLAMKKAVSDLKSKLGRDPEIILLDGRGKIPNFSIDQENFIGGDKHVFTISAASIVAKVTRDRMMLRYHERFPQYGFSVHKGYGTRSHFEMIEKFGPCEIHRKTFAIDKTVKKSTISISE